MRDATAACRPGRSVCYTLPVIDDALWGMRAGDGPVVAMALHAGHALRAELAALCAMDDAARRREEDAGTDRWTLFAPTSIVPRRSRFEIDLNRPRARAFYLVPADAWGAPIWRRPPTRAMVERSLAEYDAFYTESAWLLSRLIRRHGKVVVYDLHTYNHRRRGPDSAPADPAANPELNLGTGTLERDYWAPVVDRFIAGLRAFDFGGRSLDLRENVRFSGGEFARWAHRRFPRTVCVLSIEVRKFFMDEWGGAVDEEQVAPIGRALAASAVSVAEGLTYLGKG